MKESSPLVSDLLLIGGGHAQVHIIKMCGMEPLRSIISENGIRVTLIARDVMTPYSGMLPGYIAGHYSFEDIHIDLHKLCSFANVRLIHASANRIVSTNKRGGLVYCDDGRPPLRYDVLSIDIGSHPMSVHNEKEDGITPVKPIAGFAKRYNDLVTRLKMSAKLYTKENPFVLVVAGAGAGGIELILSAQYNLKQVFQNVGANEDALKVVLVTRGKSILQSHCQKVQTIFERILKERNVEVIYEANITGVKSNSSNSMHQLICTNSSKSISFHECLWCTSAGVSNWLKEQTPFSTTDDGFLMVNDTFQCLDYPGVFAAGDCCHNIDHPRPKAGVFAVRAGPPLLKNIFHCLFNEKLEGFQPQKTFLSLIITGNKNAVAVRGNWAFESRYLWTLKDYIDTSFMTKFSDLPSMETQSQKIPANVIAKGSDTMLAFAAAPMRCGGCGAKVGSTTVSRVLERVRKRSNQRDTHFDADDAAVIALPAKGGGCTIHTIDFFRSFVSDPFIFGKIAAVHAMSDCHAMGAHTQSCLALAVVPYSAEESITEDTLISMLSGASDVLDMDNCALVGGHTCEGMELALGFSVNGYLDDPNKLLRKCGGCIGDCIVLTKPIGTGAIFAANMRVKSKSEYVEEALQSMMKSNGPASRYAMSNQKYIHACTDVTGFGLAGHLLEMLTSNDYESNMDTIGAKLKLNQIPFYDGAIDASKQSIYSSLQHENSRTRRAVINHTDVALACPIQYPLIYDPQTAGGLMFFVHPDHCKDFVIQLQKPENGGFAQVIGELIPYEKSNLHDGVCTIGGGSNQSGKRIWMEY